MGLIERQEIKVPPPQPEKPQPLKPLAEKPLSSANVSPLEQNKQSNPGLSAFSQPGYPTQNNPSQAVNNINKPLSTNGARQALDQNFTVTNPNKFSNYHEITLNGKTSLLGIKGTNAEGFVRDDKIGKAYKINNSKAVYEQIDKLNTTKPNDPNKKSDPNKLNPKVEAEYQKQKAAEKNNPEGKEPSLDTITDNLNKAAKLAGAIAHPALGVSGEQLAEQAKDQAIDNLKQDKMKEGMINLAKNPEVGLATLRRTVEDNPKSLKGLKEYETILQGAYGKELSPASQKTMKEQVRQLLTIPDNKLSDYAKVGKAYFQNRPAGQPFTELDSLTGGTVLGTREVKKLYYEQELTRIKNNTK